MGLGAFAREQPAVKDGGSDTSSAQRLGGVRGPWEQSHGSVLLLG